MQNVRVFLSGLFLVFFVSCSQKTISFYEIEGFYIEPLKKIAINSTEFSVILKLGPPSSVFVKEFENPIRVNIKDLPKFNKQWKYHRGMSYDWVFFLDKKVVAAFRESSDF